VNNFLICLDLPALVEKNALSLLKQKILLYFYFLSVYFFMFRGFLDLHALYTVEDYLFYFDFLIRVSNYSAIFPRKKCKFNPISCFIIFFYILPIIIDNFPLYCFFHLFCLGVCICLTPTCFHNFFTLSPVVYGSH